MASSCFNTLCLSILPSAGAFFLPARLNQLIYLTPFLSLVVTTLVLHEPLRLSTLPGLFLIITGILAGQKKQTKGDI